MMLRRYVKIYLMVLGSLTSRGYAQTAENPFGGNTRERCRKYISGIFAASNTETLRTKDAVTSADRALARLNPELTAYRKKLSTVQTKMAGENYDPKLIEERNQINAQISLYESQISEQQKMAGNARSDSDAAAKTFQGLKVQLSPLFELSMVPDPEGGPRMIFQELRWKTSCPKFRTLCPLNESDRKLLAKIAAKNDDPEQSCSRYAKIK